MVTIRSMEYIKKKWVKRAKGAVEDYRAGIQTPLEDWKSETLGAEETYYDALDRIRTERTWTRGVERTDTADWQRKALQLGPPRYPSGIDAGEPDYDRGFRPYRDEIERITLPPRRPRGDPANIERVRAIADALHAKKVGAS